MVVKADLIIHPFQDDNNQHHGHGKTLVHSQQTQTAVTELSDDCGRVISSQVQVQSSPYKNTRLAQDEEEINRRDT